MNKEPVQVEVYLAQYSQEAKYLNKGEPIYQCHLGHKWVKLRVENFSVPSSGDLALVSYLECPWCSNPLEALAEEEQNEHRA